MNAELCTCVLGPSIRPSSGSIQDLSRLDRAHLRHNKSVLEPISESWIVRSCTCALGPSLCTLLGISLRTPLGPCDRARQGLCVRQCVSLSLSLSLSLSISLYQVS